jgi:hypothetical protein
MFCLVVVACGYVYPHLRLRPVEAPVSVKIFPAPVLPAPAEEP